MSDPWMKFYPSDWMGEPKLKLVSREARSLWIDMLCLMHQAGTGRLEKSGRPMTEKELARILGDNPRTIRKLLAELIAEDVCLIVKGSFVASSRMVKDFEKAERDRLNGSKGGSPLLKNKGLAENWVNPEDKAQKPEARSQSPPTPSGYPPQGGDEKKPAPKQRGSRLSEDWTLTPEYSLAAAKLGFSDQDAQNEADRFRDYWIAKSGKDATKRDWLATWRNWLRNASQNRLSGNLGRPASQSERIANAVRKAGAEGGGRY